MLNRSHLRGAHLLVAFASSTLVSAAPLQADIATNVVQAVQSAQDQTAASLAIASTPSDPASADEGASGKTIGQGEASFYGRELAGNRTASGERFDPKDFTAAHRSLPLGSKIRVVNMANGKSVVVRVNDRGPFARSRLIDISYAAAEQLQMVRSGKAKVRLELIA